MDVSDLSVGDVNLAKAYDAKAPWLFLSLAIQVPLGVVDPTVLEECAALYSVVGSSQIGGHYKDG